MSDKDLSYDDDFLDNLMEDVMGDSSSKDEKLKGEDESSHNIDDNESEEVVEDSSENGEIEEVSETQIEEIEPEPEPKPKRSRRPGGLLGQLGASSNDSSQDGEVSSDDFESDGEEDVNEVIEEEIEWEPEPEITDELDAEHTDESFETESTDTFEVEEDVDTPIESEDSSDDLFDDMLDDLSENEDIESARKRAELDPDVEIPLEKPGMDEIIVTPDGKSLADMLPGMRGGNKPVAKVVSDIRNQEKVVEIQGNKFSDNRYTKHVEVIDEEKARDNERVALSMKYLQRNAEFTEQEKIIMRNLGLTSEQLSKVMRSQELSQKEKGELIALGRYGSEKHFKGRRYRTTVGDSAMLEFLVKFKFANTRILRWISNEPQGRTWRKLSRLRDSGLVESKSLIGVPDLWGATPSGTAISGYAYAPGLRPMPKMFSISSNMGVNYIAACLWFNSVNVLNLDDFPAENRIISLQDDGRDRVRGEMLVAEYEIRSSLGKEISPQSTTMQTLGDERLYDVISSNVRREVELWEQGGKTGDSPEFLLGNEYMWVLFPTSQLTLSYHVPDLVVKRERGPNGEPRSIAVEMERFDKSNDRYDKIMLAYKLDEHLYERVIWITPNTRVARALEQAAKSVGFDRYSIIPIITEDGVYDKQDIWMI